MMFQAQFLLSEKTLCYLNHIIIKFSYIISLINGLIDHPIS